MEDTSEMLEMNSIQACRAGSLVAADLVFGHGMAPLKYEIIAN